MKYFIVLSILVVVLFGSGGPDDFGYTWVDSNDPGGPVFNWIEISGTGTDMQLLDDNYFWGIPYSFQFYGTTYNPLAVGSNGTIYFEDEYLGSENWALPDTFWFYGNIEKVIAIFWDDLNAEGTGAGKDYYQIIGNNLVVEWDSIPLYNYPTYFEKFEAILYGNGDIVMQYKVIGPDSGRSATIGIQGSGHVHTPQGDVFWFLEYSCNQPVLYNGLAIKYVNPLGINEENVGKIGKSWFNIPTIINDVATIKFSIPTSANVKIEVFDVVGRPCATILNQRFAQGTHSVSVNFDLPAGIYFYRLDTACEQIVKKGLIIK